MTTIAFIGLGAMGAGMAANLAKSQFSVQAFDLNPAALEAAVAAGCHAKASIAEAVAGAEIVVSMLPTGAHVKAVMAEIAQHATKGTLLVDSSTIAVEEARAIAAAALEAGFPFLDAPVSGGTGGANAGTLTFMVGGEADAFAKAQPALNAMGKNIIHAGAVGAGQAAKICNNMILGITMIATCEAFVLAEKLGLDAQKFYDIASTSSGQSWSMTTYCPVPGPVPTSPANRDYAAGFATALMLKDLKLAAQAASTAAANTPLGAAAAQLFALHASQGHGSEDFSGIIKMLRGGH
jgi:3-hydroxyisobutyrate dehydrogenase